MAYAKWFGATRQRSLQLHQLSISPQGQNQCQISGTYTASFVETNGRNAIQRGRINMVLQWVASGYKIIRLSY